MLSKVSSKQLREEKGHAVLFKMNKKMVHRNPQQEIVLTNETLSLQLCKRRDASVLRFLGREAQTSDETLKILTQVVKPLKKVRKVIIECQW